MTDAELKELRAALTQAIREIDEAVLANEDAERLWGSAVDFNLVNRMAREKKERQERKLGAL